MHHSPRSGLLTIKKKRRLFFFFFMSFEQKNVNKKLKLHLSSSVHFLLYRGLEVIEWRLFTIIVMQSVLIHELKSIGFL